jgi:prevent-host-death family protein
LANQEPTVKIVNAHAARTNLSALLKRAQAGEDIVIASDGVPVAKLVAVSCS